jgi:TDG/mug DNA glycosylase family protein
MPPPPHVLPDVLAPDLVTVFCGSAVGRKSAQVGAYYAGPGNKFWDTLHRAGLTPRRFQPHEYREVLSLRIGFTDMNKTESGADAVLTRAADDPDGLAARIVAYQPAIVAFTAKRPADVFFARMLDARVDGYGLQPVRVGPTRLFVLPSPSGLARRFWDDRPWHALAALHRRIVEGNDTA